MLFNHQAEPPLHKKCLSEIPTPPSAIILKANDNSDTLKEQIHNFLTSPYIKPLKKKSNIYRSSTYKELYRQEKTYKEKMGNGDFYKNLKNLSHSNIYEINDFFITNDFNQPANIFILTNLIKFIVSNSNNGVYKNNSQIIFNLLKKAVFLKENVGLYKIDIINAYIYTNYFYNNYKSSLDKFYSPNAIFRSVIFNALKNRNAIDDTVTEQFKKIFKIDKQSLNTSSETLYMCLNSKMNISYTDYIKNEKTLLNGKF